MTRRRQALPDRPGLWVDTIGDDPHALELELTPVYAPFSKGVLGVWWMTIFAFMVVPAATLASAVFAGDAGSMAAGITALVGGAMCLGGLGLSMHWVSTGVRLELDSHQFRVTERTLLGDETWEAPLADIRDVQVLPEAVLVVGASGPLKRVALPDRSRATRSEIAHLVLEHAGRRTRGDPEDIPRALLAARAQGQRT